MEVVGAWRERGRCSKSLLGERRSRAGTSVLKTLHVTPGSPCAPADTGVLADFVTSLAGCQHIPGKFKHWKREAMFSMASSSANAEQHFTGQRRDASAARGNSLSRMSAICCRWCGLSSLLWAMGRSGLGSGGGLGVFPASVNVSDPPAQPAVQCLLAVSHHDSH